MEQTLYPPKFQATKADALLELREVNIEINKRKIEYEAILRMSFGASKWLESVKQDARKVSKKSNKDVEFVYKELEKVDESLRERKKEVVEANASYASVSRNVASEQRELNVILAKILNAKSDSTKVIKQAVAHQEQTAKFMSDNDHKTTSAKSIFKKLKQKIKVLRKEVDARDKKNKEDAEYNRKWSDYLRSKERDLRLWEVRVIRKVKKYFPNATLSFKELDGKERNITTKL